MKIIKLMTDYFCWPLWWSGDDAGNIDPTTLGLDQGLLEQLNVWAKKYDTILDMENPRDSGFETEGDKIQFEKEGVELWQKLRVALPAYTVVYFSQQFHRIFEEPEQLNNTVKNANLDWKSINRK